MRVHLCVSVCVFSLSWLVVVRLLQVEKAPLESYADVGGLEQQVQEIKEAVELPLTHPELYEDIGIKPPKASWTQ
jgi:ATP-dependent 26S proteasome regulatory subunit